MTYVKICGCRTPEQALVAAEAGADFVGLNFVPTSKRRVSPAEAYDIVSALGKPLRDLEMTEPPGLYRAESNELSAWYEHGAGALERLLARKRPITVGVFANHDPDEINDLVEECGVDLIQLHGGEPWSACLAANRQVIKVVHIRPDDTVESALGRVETGGAMALMLDTANASALGGTGQTFDWRIASLIGNIVPYWLAGGLDPDNVAEAINVAHPWAVDVASGVETDGVKDLAKIRDFVQNAKAAL